MLLLSILIFASCQEEEFQLIEDNSANLSLGSPLNDLLLRVSQHATSIDNVIDGTDCFSVVLPVTIFVNGQQIVVESAADYETVQQVIDEFPTDDDVVSYVFPIQVQFENFSIQQVDDLQSLAIILQSCGSDDGFGAISCVSIGFPVTINIYNETNQQVNAVVIYSNAQLYNLLASWSVSDYLAIQYPITFTNAAGQNITITNNSSLEDVLQDAIDDCDDSSSGGGGNTLATILVEGTWYVSYYFHNEDETTLYASYTFTFNTNGAVQATGAQTVNGVWSYYFENNEDYLELDFEGGTLSDLDDNWEVIEFTSNQIRLKDGSGDSTDYLYFTKN
jgi:hypothetical protein